MKITYYENDLRKTIEINPDHQSIRIRPDQETNFAHVWVINEKSGTMSVASYNNINRVVGWMKNGAKLKKETYRIS
tara:strand:- start:449 stop:676 length:228 start_codon:yes stop_codon:yes gene_type:complete